MGGIATYPLCSQGSPEQGTKSEVATEPLPLQTTSMMIYGEKKEKKQGPVLNHPYAPMAHFCQPRELNQGSSNCKCSVPPTRVLVIFENFYCEVG